MKKDVTKEFNQNLEKVYDELNRLDKDMMEFNQHSIDEIWDAYHDYKLSMNYN